jgi:hypothetical protein
MQSVMDNESMNKIKKYMIERGCCFSVKEVELYVIKNIVEIESKICRDEEHNMDRAEMVKTEDYTRN